MRARVYENAEATERVFLDALADRGRRDDFELRVMVLATISALTTALRAWAEDDGRGGLLALVDEALRTLRAGEPD